MLEQIGAFFDPIGAFFNAVLVSPLTNGLILLFNILSSVGLASWGLTIVVFTVIVKTVTLPLTFASLRSSKKMQRIQPLLSEVRKKFPKDRVKQQQETMALYGKHGVNPVAGCLPMLVQMPIWIALYQALFRLADPDSSTFESFAQPFLWIPSLAVNEGMPYILAGLSGITGYAMMRMTMIKSDDPQQKMTQQIMQFMPVMYLIFAIQPVVTAGLVLYWVTTNIITVIQQLFLTGWGNLLPQSIQARTGYFQKGFIGIQIDNEQRLRETAAAVSAEIDERIAAEKSAEERRYEKPQDGGKPKRRPTVSSARGPSQRSLTAGGSGRRRKRKKKNASRS